MPDDRDPGSSPRPDLAAEITKLVGSIQEWARKALPESSIGHGPECQWCPICQLVNAVRGESPQTAERVGERFAEAGAAVTAAVRALAEAAVTRTQREPGDRPRPSPRVQHIDLDDTRES